MDRRNFLNLSLLGVAGLALSQESLAALPRILTTSVPACKRDKSYSIVILGDTHYDAEPATIYHSDYNEPKEWLNEVQRKEFARNAEMWRERCPRLLQRAGALVGSDTIMAFQMGDLVQGDCGNPDVHIKMLSDVMDRFKGELGSLPLVTVAGNHDIRGTGAREAYGAYMPQRMAQELGKEITNTTFGFNIGDDAYIVIDFNSPDDARIESLLAATEGARHIFVISHGPLFPMDAKSCRWFFHGKASKRDTAARLHFRAEFAKRQVICLCGHSHRTCLTEWAGEGGLITQLEMNSVWSSEKLGSYTVDTADPATYGTVRQGYSKMPDGSPIVDESALFEEYRPGLTRYISSPAAGSYKMRVTPKHVEIDFYAGDSQKRSACFKLR